MRLELKIKKYGCAFEARPVSNGMKERTAEILKTGIQYFIKTGFPITSERLYEEYNFGIKPAMIRCELNALDDEGYLEQNHPSGGRWPTHKGYKFFVDNLLSMEEKNSNSLDRSFGHLVDDLLRGDKRSFVKQISDSTNMLSVGYEPDHDEFYNSGLHDLFSRLEMNVKKDFLKVVEDFELITKRLEEDREWWEGSSTTWPQVFIGHSPVTKSKHISVIAERLNLPQGDFLLFLVGPNRMDYERSIHMIRFLQRSIDDKC